MRDVVVLGAAGHAKVCIEVLRAAGLYRPYACLAPDSTLPAILGVPVIRGPDTEGLLRVRGEGVSSAFVALGANRVRDDVGAIVERAGFALIRAVDPWARLSPSAHIGVGVLLMPGAIVNADAVLGDLSIVNSGAVIEHDCRLGRACHVGPGAVLAGNVALGDRSFVGAGAVVRPSIRIGADVMVGAGAVVVGDVADDTIVTGVPARPFKASRAP
jgi:UDP-perosamine 4-acetyltransferase